VLEPRVLFHGDPFADGGLVATYFDNADFTSLALTRTDRDINFYWGSDSPADAVDQDSFSARWTGQIIPHTSATYTFTLRADGGVKLLIGGQVLIDALAAPQGTFIDHTASIALAEDSPADIEVDYVEQSGAAGVRLYWQTPTIAREIVPADHLSPDTDSPPDAPPPAPVDVAAAPISVSQTRITWTDAAANETGFEILRSANLGPASLIGTTDADATEFIDSGVTPGVRYFYRVRATSPIGNSRWADYVNTLADGDGEPVQPPAAPSELIATVFGDAIGLTWAENAADEIAFILSRRAGSGSVFEDLATLGANITEFADSEVSPGVTYSYRIRARNAVGDSAASNIVEATIPIEEPSDDFTDITWTTAEPAPIARNESLVATIDGKLYVFAGFDTNTEPMSRVDVYDPATDTWTRLSDMPTRLTHAGTATVGRSVYFAGGYIGANPTGGSQIFGVTDVWRYDVDTDTYTAMPDLPSRRGSGGLVALGNELHFFGGNNSDREDVGDHYVLNLDGGTQWTTAAPLPNGRSHMGYAALGGKIYAISGQIGNDEDLITQNDVHVWDPANPGVWTEIPSIPQAVSHISSSTFVVGDRILVLGGETAHQAAIRTNWAYDPAINAWTELTGLPSARRSGVGGVIDGVLYYSGGSKTTTTYVGTPVIEG
jgi:hypothetical protein